MNKGSRILFFIFVFLMIVGRFYSQMIFLLLYLNFVGSNINNLLLSGNGFLIREEDDLKETNQS